MKGKPRLAAVLEDLARQGLTTAEVYAKAGRSRRFERGVGGEAVAMSEEAGWAVRAGDDRCSLFAAAAGEPEPDFPWPQPDGARLVLPAPGPPVPWSEPPDFAAPLSAEREGLALLAGVERALSEELPGARLLSASLDDGASESWLLSSRGVEAAWRSRAAALHLVAAEPGGASATLAAAEPEARRFRPRAMARRLATSLSIAAQGKPPERDRASLLLAPAVGCRLLAGLLPLLVGPEAERRVARFTDRAGRLGSEALTLVDDGRLDGGALAAPCDGEGIATREAILVEGGRLRQTLGANPPEGKAPGGAVRRPGFRDLPRPAPSHLYLRPQPKIAVAALLSQVARGYYLIDASGPGRFDLGEDRFELPVRGFALAAGRARAPVAGAHLAGAISSLLHGVQAVARDLEFLPLDGMIGAPTLLVTGIEIT